MIGTTKQVTTVAIDFGTSNTVVCTLDNTTQTPKILKLNPISRCFETNNDTTDVVPSLVFVQGAEQFIVGEPVRGQQLGIEQPERLFAAFKRDLAADYRSPDRQIDGTVYSPESITEVFLQQIWQQVVAQPLQPNRVIFTVPVGAFNRYLSWFQELQQKLQIPVVQIVDESTAAAFGYGVSQPGAVVLVVDFGGGTLDLSLVKTTAPNKGQKILQAEVLAKADAYIGGVDIDNWIAQHYLQQIGSSRRELTNRSWQKLLEMAEEVKIQLSNTTEATAHWQDTETAISHQLQLTRTELEQILRSHQLLPQVQQAVEEVLAMALNKGISQEEIEQVLLVGGSCQIPAVQQLIVSQFGQESVSLHQPLAAVAQGALAVGHIIGVDDYLQHSYAIRLWDAKAETAIYFPLFEKGSPYPSKRPKTLHLQLITNEQREIRLQIGELREQASVEITYNEQGAITSNQLPQTTEFQLLEPQSQQHCVIPLAPTGKTGVDRIRLTCEINAQRVLLLTVTDLLTQQVLLQQEVMRANPYQPRINQVLTESPSSAPSDGAILGGLAGAKKRLETILEESAPRESSTATPPIIQPRINWHLLQCRYQFTSHRDAVTSVAISPDGATLASGSRDKTIRLWHLPTGQFLHLLISHNDAVSDLTISPDGKLLASGSQDKTIRLWHLRSGQWLRTVTGHSAPIFAVTFSPDGQTLASGGWEEFLTLRQLFTKTPPSRLFAHRGGVSAIAFSPDGQTVVSCGDNNIKMWHLETKELLQTFSGHSDLVLTVAISPNGQLLASGSSQAIKLWDLGTGELIHTLTGLSSNILSLAYSPDGQILASGSYKKLSLWDLGSGELLRDPLEHQGDVVSIAFSPQGQTLVSGSTDGTIKVWGIEN
ncbi:MAG: Hsp70 family protein [Symploca sp. SIO2G7]|nr:Hsp70 family protein [Symploca sp. SIO2G7]